MKKRMIILGLIILASMITFCACQAGTDQTSEQNSSSTVAEPKPVPEQTTDSAVENENITDTFKAQKENLEDKAKLALSIIGKTREEAISILGVEYEEQLTGDGLLSLVYKDIGMRIILESYDSTQTDIKVYYIVFDNNYSFNGCKSGMLFDQIKEKLGDTKTVETFVETPDHKAYTLTYTYGNAKLEFSSYDKSGSDSNMFLSLLINAPGFFNDIGKTFSELREQHPEFEINTRDYGLPDSAAICFGEPGAKYAYFFFDTQDGDAEGAMDKCASQLKCAGFYTTAGTLFPEMKDDMPFSDFFSMIGVSDYEYDTEEGCGQGWLFFQFNNMDVQLNTNEINSGGGYEFTGLKNVKLSAPVAIIDKELYHQNFKLADEVMFD